MTVLYMLDELPVLTQTFVTDEIDERRRQGDDVRVLVMWPKDGYARWDAEPLVRWSAREQLRSLTALAVHRPRALARAWAVARRAPEPERISMPFRQLAAWAHALRGEPITVVHAHFGWAAATRAQVLSLLTGAPWSMTLHGNDAFGQADQLADKLRSADLVVTVCEYFRRHLIGVVDREVVVVPCGVAVPGVLPADRGRGASLVTAGRLVEKKGIDVLLDACALAGDAVPDLTIVGDGPLRRALEEQAERLGLTDKVTFAGALSHDETLRIIGTGRVFALAARIAADGDRDSMPVVVKEAMARAVPVVVTDTAGLPELVNDRNGWVVPADDPAALAAALCDALAGGPAVARRAEQGRRDVGAMTIERTVASLRAHQAELGRR